MTRAAAAERQGKLLDHLDQCGACRRLQYCPKGRLLRQQVREARDALRPL
ncbi:hypothetical protein ACFYO9_27795 [Streptomyces sp. NPDC005863]